MMSDNPETVLTLPSTVGSYKYATLWHDQATNLNIIHYRVFCWHLNKTGAQAKFGITIGNGSNATSPATYQLLNFRHTMAIATNYINHGICTAKALVGNKLDYDDPVNPTIAAGAVGLLKSWDVPNNGLIGGVIEFTLRHNDPSRQDNLNYRVRSVMANNINADLRLNQSLVVSAEGAHPRGSWPFSNIRSTLNFDAGSANSWKYFNISNGGNPANDQLTDDMMTKAKSFDSANAHSSNKGHYGIRNVVTVNLKNPNPSEKK